MTGKLTDRAAAARAIDVRQQGVWTHLPSIDSDLEVEVRCTGPTGVSGPHEELAGGDGVTDRDAVLPGSVAVDPPGAVVAVDGQANATCLLASSEPPAVEGPVHVRTLTPAEARALAAMLWHQADMAERAR